MLSRETKELKTCNSEAFICLIGSHGPGFPSVIRGFVWDLMWNLKIEGNGERKKQQKKSCVQQGVPTTFSLFRSKKAISDLESIPTSIGEDKMERTVAIKKYDRHTAPISKRAPRWTYRPKILDSRELQKYSDAG
ncbi:unnamed protein product [Dovyalis caffra]|uniref:Uncharacterized protein n=1 Tax=Dovyalis caffra TaxID=77055 RepID=A0AAV1SG70_9ROSI|nr:unnamed protein product [Dovyalis caffra]